ncbi:MAG TPA: sigma-70 family RNA polymerase sigma factor [Thermoanaerobaculia bacterium]|nr:sigma-70 family RNA polymerase sigma factor [Thermoanaerobaculia bacterium]
MHEPARAVPGAGDDELMARVGEGDREAFVALVDRYKDPIVNYLARLAGDRDRAEDLAQETFLRLFRSAPRYSEQGQLRGYLYRIATNLVRSEARRARRLRLLQPLLDLAGRAAEPASSAAGLLRDELQRQVAAAVAELPLRWRVPLVLHEIEGWSYAAIAAQLDVREGTVKSRIHRGRRQLRRALEPYWNGGAASWKTTG